MREIATKTNIYVGTHNGVANNWNIANCLSTVLGIVHAIERVV